MPVIKEHLNNFFNLLLKCTTSWQQLQTNRGLEEWKQKAFMVDTSLYKNSYLPKMQGSSHHLWTLLPSSGFLLLSCNFCCYFTPFLSIKHFSISSLLAIPLQAGKCQATPMSFYHSFCSSQNFYIGNNLYRDFSRHLWQVLQIFEIQGPSQSSKNSMLNLE